MQVNFQICKIGKKKLHVIKKIQSVYSFFRKKGFKSVLWCYLFGKDNFEDVLINHPKIHWGHSSSVIC